MHGNGTDLLQALHADLDLIKNAIETEDHAATERIVAEHDARVREYLQAYGAAAAAPALQELLVQQQAVTERMRQLRDEAADHLRSERQSRRATNAYQQAGSLA